MAATPSVTINISLTTTPAAPTNFNIEQTGLQSINITWTKGDAANITIVRSSTLGYPYSIFDGSSTYSGTGTSVAVTGLNLSSNTYYYRAWSQNAYATSEGYAQDSIGHGAASDSTTTFTITGFSLTGDGFGIVEMIFVIAFLAIAIWKKSWIRVTTSMCVIIWGVFAAQYDIKVAAPLLGIATILFFMGILKMIEARRAEAAEEA